MPHLLTTASMLTCPHGGTVSVTTSNNTAKAGDFLVRVSDTFTIGGCGFNVAGAPHPCVTVQWTKSTLRCKVDDLLLAEDSIGMCMAADHAPQGPVIIQSTQTHVAGL